MNLTPKLQAEYDMMRLPIPSGMTKAQTITYLSALIDRVWKADFAINAINEHHQLKQTVEELREALRKIADCYYDDVLTETAKQRSIAVKAIAETEASHD